MMRKLLQRKWLWNNNNVSLSISTVLNINSVENYSSEPNLTGLKDLLGFLFTKNLKKGLFGFNIFPRAKRKLYLIV